MEKLIELLGGQNNFYIAAGGLVLVLFLILLFLVSSRKRREKKEVEELPVAPEEKVEEAQEERREVIEEVIVKEEKPPQKPKTLEEGLQKTRGSFLKRLNQLFKGGISPETYEELEALLITADFGVKTTQKLLSRLKKRALEEGIKDPESLKKLLANEILSIFNAIPEKKLPEVKPLVIMVVGVNGTGKTTTIGKLGRYFKEQGKSVVFAAGDTFRAAAIEQLEIWAERVGARIVKHQEGSDSAAIFYDAIESALHRGDDIVIGDTAGRLHTKQNLMDELKKVKRVSGKAMEGAPHEIWLVIDAVTGQNAVRQAQEFNKILGVTGIILTKLDGTAKGGIVVAIADEFKIPIIFIGIGEGEEDLRPFDAKEFVKALLE